MNMGGSISLSDYIDLPLFLRTEICAALNENITNQNKKQEELSRSLE